MTIPKNIDALEFVRNRLKKRSLAEILKNIREADEVTQEELGARINVSKQYISDLENGRRNPSIAMAKKLAIALGYPDFFFVEPVFNDELKRAGINAHIDLKAG